MMFTKQHFALVAEIIRTNSNTVGISESFDNGAKFAGAEISIALASLFSKDNPKFNTEKFSLACGLDK